MEGQRVECGTLIRPLVAGKPDLGTIDIGYALVRRKNEDRPAVNTILVNPGGPGGAAVGLAGVYTYMLSALTEDHDILLVDPRGVGASTPLNCGLGVAEMQLGTRADLRRNIAACGAVLGQKAEGYTSAATADDFNAVRRKLGIGEVVLVGHSYGTYLLPVYAERHPETVRSMVLSGAYPIAFDSFGRPSAASVRSAVRKVCLRSGACDGDTILRDLRRVAAKLRAKPIDLKVAVRGATRTVQLTESRLVTLLYSNASSGVGAVAGEAPLIGRLPAAIHRAARGDTVALVAEAAGSIERGAADAEGVDFALGVSVMCNDYPRRWSVDAPLQERWRQFKSALSRADPAAFAPFSREGFVYGQLDGAEVCIEWPKAGSAAPYESSGRFPDVPTLVLSGDLDSITTVGNSRLAAAQFPGAEFVTVPNAGHVPDQEASGCASGIVAGFVREERLGDTSCLAHIPPVAVTPVR
ncbi:alpha/beta fold hydrolase [Sinosporangium siamense]|uniref:Alpha/beta hydrolase n=1 Tax=Sinosporangium siamense TaxID=1367973 RepID=A0A919RKD4_9ACTN|nr:alpha/beta fold hydrolase [Sinosporangium siamense]GII95451.1 alpha/beta hydrolase [Sinosporangium siamense]